VNTVEGLGTAVQNSIALYITNFRFCRKLLLHFTSKTLMSCEFYTRAPGIGCMHARKSNPIAKDIHRVIFCVAFYVFALSSCSLHYVYVLNEYI